MTFRCCLIHVMLLALLAVLLAAPAHAGNLFPFFKDHSPYCPPDWVGNPRRIVAAPPGPHRYGEYNVCCPWYGYGFGVPTYQWGYFGATYRGACVCHKGYYGTFSQWGYRWGY